MQPTIMFLIIVSFLFSLTNYAKAQGTRFIGPISQPGGVALDLNDNIYVASTSTDQIIKFSPEGVQLKLFKTTSPELHPYGLSLDKTGNVYITQLNTSDKNSDDTLFTYHHIVKYYLNGSIASVFDTSNPSLNRPLGLGVDGNYNIYIADTGNNRVVKLGSDGAQLAVFNTNDPCLNKPSDIAIDDKDIIHVADTGNNRIVKFTTTGAQLETFTTINAETIAVDVDYELYVADYKTSELLRLTSNGIQSTVYTFSPTFEPRGLSVDIYGTLYIGDSNNNRVIVSYRPCPVSSSTKTSSKICNFENDNHNTTAVIIAVTCGIVLLTLAWIYINCYKNTRKLNCCKRSEERNGISRDGLLEDHASSAH